MSRENSIANVITMALEGYDYSVASRMAGRAGSSSPIGGKGNALEIMYADKKNLENVFKPGNLKTQLTKSSTATQADLITMNGSKVFERIQCKDTSSISGTAKTIKQVQSGQYRPTQLVGTTESAAAYNAKASQCGISKVMKDSGISTKDTSRISNKFNGVTSTTGIGNMVGTSAKLGGTLSGTFALADSLISGDDFSETTRNVTSSALKGATSSAVSTATAEGTLVALAAAPIPLGAKIIIAAGTSLLASSVTSELTGDICDGIAEVASDIADGVSDFFDGLFGFF